MSDKPSDMRINRLAEEITNLQRKHVGIDQTGDQVDASVRTRFTALCKEFDRREPGSRTRGMDAPRVALEEEIRKNTERIVLLQGLANKQADAIDRDGWDDRFGALTVDKMFWESFKLQCRNLFLEVEVERCKTHEA